MASIPISAQDSQNAPPRRKVADVQQERPRLPAIVVGVDIGLTCTGVAYSTMDMKMPRVIKTWPNSNGKVDDKVPTTIQYRAGNKGILSWGFKCPSSRKVPETRVIDRFKLYLDNEFLDAAPEKPGTHDDVQMWFKDFLRALYNYITDLIRSELKLSMQDWRLEAVQFDFSVPTAWGTAELDTLENIVKRAGFGTETAHSVAITLTEAEAAAVYTARSPKDLHSASHPEDEEDFIRRSPPERPRLRKDDILLVCDAGGGTTDISVLQVKAVKEISGRQGVSEFAVLKRLDEIDAQPTVADTPPLQPNLLAIGSVQIDDDLRKETERRLSHIFREDHEAEDCVNQVMVTLRKIKKNFGSRELEHLQVFKVRVPGTQDSLSNVDAHLDNGRMVFRKKDIEKIFDSQVSRIISAIDGHLGRLRVVLPNKQVSYFVLSGGLGSSVYVQKCISKRYGRGVDEKNVLISDKPQLAVCIGLVIDRVHQLNYHQSIISTRCCSSSYGIIFNERYDRKRHSNTRARKSTIDGHKYAVDQIYWLIRKGDEIPRDRPICQRFSRIVATKSLTETWADGIAKSQTRSDRLPPSLHEGDARQVGKILTKLGPLDLSEDRDDVQQRKKYYFGIKTGEYRKITLEVRIYIGFADINFQIWFAGERVGEQNNSIEVAWMCTGSSRVGGSHELDNDEETGNEEEDSDAWLNSLFAIQE